MPSRVVRFPDPERKSRDADAAPMRDPGDSAIIIVLPVVRVERYDDRHEPVMGRIFRDE